MDIFILRKRLMTSNKFDEWFNESVYINDSTFSFAETLIDNSVLQTEEKGRLLRELNDMNQEELDQLIERLKSKQTCPIESGRGYSVTEINRKVKWILKRQ